MRSPGRGADRIASRSVLGFVPNVMVAFNPAYLAALAGPGRLGFIATNGLHDTVVIEGAQEDEYRQRIREGWRVALIRPICRSLTPKLFHSRAELEGARVFSYMLVILERPGAADTLRA
jgi:hypothetical protein